MQIEPYNAADIGVFMRNFMLNNYYCPLNNDFLAHVCA